MSVTLCVLLCIYVVTTNKLSPPSVAAVSTVCVECVARYSYLLIVFFLNDATCAELLIETHKKTYKIKILSFLLSLAFFCLLIIGVEFYCCI